MVVGYGWSVVRRSSVSFGELVLAHWCVFVLDVCRTQTCRFSGLRIYPGKGIQFIRVDGQVGKGGAPVSFGSAQVALCGAGSACTGRTECAVESAGAATGGRDIRGVSLRVVSEAQASATGIGVVGLSRDGAAVWELGLMFHACPNELHAGVNRGDCSTRGVGRRWCGRAH